MRKTIKIAFAISLSSFVFIGCAGKSQEMSKLVHVDPVRKNIENNVTDSIYEINRKAELANLIKEPAIPVKTPDKIMRILLLPYVDKNQLLQTSSFMFTKVDDGKWIIGDYLNQESESVSKTLMPLH